jgi:hypothetical protein
VTETEAQRLAREARERADAASVQRATEKAREAVQRALDEQQK